MTCREVDREHRPEGVVGQEEAVAGNVVRYRVETGPDDGMLTALAHHGAGALTARATSLLDARPGAAAVERCDRREVVAAALHETPEADHGVRGRALAACGPAAHIGWASVRGAHVRGAQVRRPQVADHAEVRACVADVTRVGSRAALFASKPQ